MDIAAAILIPVAFGLAGGLLAGDAATAWLPGLRQPRYALSLRLWIVVGVIYYVLCAAILLCRLPASSAARAARIVGECRRDCRSASASDRARVEAGLNWLVQSAAGAAAPPECCTLLAKEVALMLRFLRNRLQPVVQRAMRIVGRVFSRWCKPLAATPLVGTIADLARSKPQLIAENLLLRQQLIVLNRAGKRPRCTRADRVLVVMLASKVKHWREALLIIRPETVLRRHREGMRLFWKAKSRAASQEPRIAVEAIALIKEMAASNRLWGADRIRGEPRKLD